jgi:protein-disulfide isomerase
VLAPVTSNDHVRGPADAPIMIVEYGDFECPICKQAAPAVTLLTRRFAGRIRFAFRHFPLEALHPLALIAAEAAEAAGAQARFWQMHDLLFAHQPHFQMGQLIYFAQHLGLDVRRFREELADHSHAARIRADVESGRRAGVRATPAFYVNGQVCDVSFGIENLRRTVIELLGETGIREEAGLAQRDRSLVTFFQTQQ